MIRSLLLTVLALAAIVLAAVWQPADEASRGGAATAGPATGQVTLCPPPGGERGATLSPDLRRRLEDVQTTIVGHRDDLAAMGVHIAAVRIDPAAKRVRVAVPGNLPLVVGYVSEAMDPGLVCVEIGGVVE